MSKPVSQQKYALIRERISTVQILSARMSLSIVVITNQDSQQHTK